MDTVSEKAYGKINLSLDVIGKRQDGYHLVRMVMQTVDIYDTVTVTRLPRSEEMSPAGTALSRPKSVPERVVPAGLISVETDSGKIPSGPDNLVWKAADVMRRTYGITDGLSIHLVKRIPIAAGMAGGSADAAAVFRLIRKLYDLPSSDEELQKLALPLGADIPYCITGGTQLSEGIGEVLTRLPDAPQNTLLVVKPDIDVSTGLVYRSFDSIPEKEVRHPDVDRMLQAVRDHDLRGMAAACGNVLEQKTGAEYPIIGELEKFFLDHGALNSIMTGSGPTVFALYDDAKAADGAFAQLQADPAYGNFMKFQTCFTSPS